MLRHNQAVGKGRNKGGGTDTLSSNRSALCAREGALFYCSFGSPIAFPCELITSTVPRLVNGSQDHNNKSMNGPTSLHAVLKSSCQVNELFYSFIFRQ